MKLINLSSDSLKIIQSQAFTDSEPGSVVKDFNRFLNRLIEKPVPLSKGKRQPVQKWTALLDEELTNPDKPELKRPLTIHYPSTLGLYLLVRASGLGRFIVAGANKFQLIIHENMLAQWQQLTTVEQYFSLLDAWLTRGVSDIIGEKLSGRSHCILGCSGTNFLRTSDFTEEPISEATLEVLPHSLGAYNVALLNLFGLANIRWQENNQLGHLQFTPLGVTLFNAFQKSIDLHGLFLPSGCKDILYEIGGMQKVVRQWRNDIKQLLLPIEQKLKDSYIIDVSMPAYKCRRTLMVPLGTSFEKLAKSVLSAFSFGYQHLYHFVYEDCYGDIYKVADPHLKPRYNDYADDTSLKDLQPAPGDQLRFLYDLNDPWEFILDIKDGLDEQADTITVINRKGEAPREV
ncbi:plasmid pRiA4b ORF-3 family protein [Endozoicomonas euniceicola]|uniref:Plasmid pRiA4b ORF-3 family protein n=1 Tax=Endozoicomonas euniceicola TaxID=1234143 RepID=A0ABY6GTM9_9GAMM|nr:plasmid pRiA4b ORF-3 family protein [Endozoicomonas euniceicola]UYM15406.1 plasmid pRiA4b ORF-3 family protein [Endozoicomonas euniceicola]